MNASETNDASSLSIARQLLIYLLIPVIVIVGLAAASAIWVAGRSVNKLYDQQMQNNAEILLAFLHYEFSEEQEEHDDEDDESEHIDAELIEIVDAIESQHGLAVLYRFSFDDKMLFTSGIIRYFPSCSDGFSDFEITSNNTKRNWRCYRQSQSVIQNDLPITVEFFEPVTTRKQAIRSLIITTFMPILLLPLIVFLMTRWGINRCMRLLHGVRNEVSARSVNNLKRIPRSGKPAELLPIVDSVNGLLAGVERGIIREKQFTDDAAHELRTPVTSIKMSEQLIRREHQGTGIDQYLDNLRDSAEHSSKLIEQLLRLARLQTTQSMDIGPVNINDIVNIQLGILSPQLTDKALAVEISGGSSESVTLMANEASIGLLINNLLANAIKFSPSDDTIIINIGTNNLRVEDNGPGIAPDERGKVFDRFYRGDNGHKAGGTGLGLAIARSIADAHGFTLTSVHAIKGTGAAFLLEYQQQPENINGEAG